MHGIEGHEMDYTISIIVVPTIIALDGCIYMYIYHNNCNM